MAKYIDADKLEAEIERLKKDNEISEDKDYAQYELDVACGYDMALDDVLSFLSDLESEKPVPKDLEEAAEEYRKGVCEHPMYYTYTKQCFIAGAKWQKEQMLNEAVEISYKGGTARINGEERPFEGGKVRVIIVVKEGEK